MSSNQPVVISNNSNGFIEVDICEVSDWEGFDKLILFLKNEYSISITKKIDGPDARRWVLKSGESDFELVHDSPYGNTLISTNEKSNALVKNIGLDLSRRLSMPPKDAG